jgi:apolipoprotein N-acyltransferase
MRPVDWFLAGAGVVLGLAAMAVDHLLGDDPGLEDPPTFLISAVLVVALVAALFGLVVRRPGDQRRAAVVVAVLGLLSLAFVWLGVPFAVAPAAIALGLRTAGRAGTFAVALGAAVLALVTVGYAYSAVDKLG